MRETTELIMRACNASTDFELNNSYLKKQYILKNIELVKSANKKFREIQGSFGTGYPFYALTPDQSNTIPIIGEQIRYNNELVQKVLQDAATNNKYIEWKCAHCLSEKGNQLPDLKQICKPCPQVDDQIKPRKVLNRLPDLDHFFVAKSEDVPAIANMLEKFFKQQNLHTSDVDPIQTIYDVLEIADDLKHGRMPSKNLPLDAHIIDYQTLYSLICQTPDMLDYANRHNQAPYLPIHPISLRKTWQKDDTAYNFVWDYLASFTAYNFEPKLQQALSETRYYIATKYSFNQIYDFLLKAAPEPQQRRYKSTPKLAEILKERIESWKNPEELIYTHIPPIQMEL